MRMTQSFPPTATRRPSEDIATQSGEEDELDDVGTLTILVQRPLVRFQHRSCPPSSTDTPNVPLSLIATALTLPVWPPSVANASRVAISHKMRTLSLPPDST